MVEPSQLRQRRPVEKAEAELHEVQTKTLAQPKGKRSSKDAQRNFYQLSILQLLLGLAYFASIYAALNFPALAKYRQRATWAYQLQHITKWGVSHAGPRDVYYAVSCFVAVIAARAVFQLVVYALLFLRKDMGVKSKIRFTEQAWSLFYYGGAAIWGLYVLKSQPYGWNAATLWIDFPHYYIDPDLKRYYLAIMAYWFTQIFIIHIEDRRKDHYQMLTHHFVTCALVVGSYVWSYTRIGQLVMIMMDGVDVFLSLAKCSKYLKVPGWITDGIFVVFLVSWILLRHFLYMYEMVYGAFPALDDLEGTCVFDFEKRSIYDPPIQCFSKKIHYAFFALALALQGITVMWLVMIMRIVVRVVQGDGAADTRSDSEEGEEDEK